MSWPSELPLDLRFVARDELFAWRYVGGLLRDTRQVKVCPEQGAASYRSLRRQAPAILGACESLVVFPQGSILGIEIDFKPGPFALARAIGRPILPIALTGGLGLGASVLATPALRRADEPPDPAIHPGGQPATKLDVERAQMHGPARSQAGRLVGDDGAPAPIRSVS